MALTDQRSSHPELTETQRQELGRYLCWHRDEEHRDPLKLALVIAGDKPAAYLGTEPWTSLRSPLSFHNGTVKLFKLCDLVAREIKDVPGWFVSPSSGRLDWLPTVRENCEAYHRRLGTILGYPSTDIACFIGSDKNIVPEEFADKDIFEPEELAYAKFVFYVPEASEAGYRRAIKRGKETYARLCTLAEQWQLPDIKTIANTVYDEFLRAIESDEPVLGTVVND